MSNTIDPANNNPVEPNQGFIVPPPGQTDAEGRLLSGDSIPVQQNPAQAAPAQAAPAQAAPAQAATAQAAPAQAAPAQAAPAQAAPAQASPAQAAPAQAAPAQAAPAQAAPDPLAATSRQNIQNLPSAQQETARLSTNQQPTLPYAAQQNWGASAANFAAQFSQPQANYNSAQSNYPDWAASKKAKRKPRAGLIISSAAAVALLVGASAGFGGAYLYGVLNPSASLPITQYNNITINDPSGANIITAAAAKAYPSVVMISVSNATNGGTGSGVIMSADGYILTNNHVVTLDGASGTPSITVKTSDGTLYGGTVVATDPYIDLAVIKLDKATGLTPATFADSDTLNVGDVAIAIGSPLGLEGTVTNGIVSALNRSISVSSPEVPAQPGTKEDQESEKNPFDFWREGSGKRTTSSGQISIPVIQTDASINPGNSGGALLNSNGDVIGINVAIATASGTADSAGSIGVGFAIPGNLALRIGNELIESGSASHGLLGAMVRTAQLKDSDPSVSGAYIDEVIQGGAADTAGLQKGDVVTSFNGKTINSSIDLTAQVRYLAGGGSAELVYVRDGVKKAVQVNLGTLQK